MTRLPTRLATCLVGLAVAGCATRSVDVRPQPVDPADFAAWDCVRLADESDAVQQRAADVAYAVDDIAGRNIVALGVGVSIFWPALFALRPNGHEAGELAQLQGRYEAMKTAAHRQGCAHTDELPPERLAALPIASGDRLVYEERTSARGASGEWALQVMSLRRDVFEFRVSQTGPSRPWRQDPLGNVVAAPAGELAWQRLFRRDIALGDVLAGELRISGDPYARALVRGQVVATGRQTIAGRAFDVAVVELFGDAQNGEFSSRLEGAIVVDRSSGLLVRLDLRSATPGFRLERRLVRVQPATP
ncbi:hypothetical protein G7087_12670 [Rubrivivax benzoatilyticus]|uniref:Lipoprotein n=2 Tax=Sphaerotilaceae TaxID=2975441 RepID=A0ABX0HW64_9BURK|nr:MULTISPECIES: hypothetical protein [Rubrivivax]MCC9598272.1 hypothetical protein [Rubrivivax sp. JA1055]MCC9645472.1 hypothetical protein [Rubrivivax sp. JA1029]NHK99232.1 hypothetical protein [Rubrivivax benzoatilyticus]NHL24905.1 hypothetical protein [Rubrivivax benzoatilyticus]